MLDAYRDLEYNMLLKAHSYLKYFPEDCSDIPNNYGERYHQEFTEIKKI